MDLGLNNRTVFITGGSTGIGKTAALAYGREPGVRVAISYFSNEAAANETVQAIHQQGGQAMAVYMNLGDHATIEQAVKAVETQFGGIDVLVNNAVQWGDPANRGKSLEEMPWAAWENMIITNLLGTVMTTRLCVPYMRAGNWGRIIHISSDLAADSMKGSGPYSTMKAALNGFMGNLVEEYSAFNILTNVVLPSWTLTERAIRFFPEGLRDGMRKAYPTQRITQPEDVAAMILFLGSAANGHVNGESIRVTGKASLPLMNYLFKEYQSLK